MQGSWGQKLIDRIYNVEKGRKRKERENSEEHTTPKRGRPKKNVSIHSRYPAVELEGDEITYKRNCTAIMKECEKNKPRKDIILPLLKETYSYRRSYILHDAISAMDVLHKFPPLNKTYAVSGWCHFYNNLLVLYISLDK